MSPGTPQPDVKTKCSLHGSADQLGSEEIPPQEIPPLRNYLWLTMLTCFCPAWPINIVALVFSILSQYSHDAEDYEGSRRLGRNARHVGIASIVIGILIITIYCIVHFTTRVA